MRVWNGMTNAGIRIVRPQREAWYCASCDRDVARYFANCPDCKAPYTPRNEE